MRCDPNEAGAESVLGRLFGLFQRSGRLLVGNCPQSVVLGRATGGLNQLYELRGSSDYAAAPAC